MNGVILTLVWAFFAFAILLWVIAHVRDSIASGKKQKVLPSGMGWIALAYFLGRHMPTGQRRSGWGRGGGGSGGGE